MGTKRNKCAHPDCDKMKPLEQYACQEHWFSLPKDIRDEIWRGFKRDGTSWFDAHKLAQSFWADQGVKSKTRKPRRVHEDVSIDDEDGGGPSR